MQYASTRPRDLADAIIAAQQLRPAYRPIRRGLAVTTLLCLLVQLLPVAPPRMLPGFTDTAALYGQSVYAGGLAADTPVAAISAGRSKSRSSGSSPRWPACITKAASGNRRSRPS